MSIKISSRDTKLSNVLNRENWIKRVPAGKFAGVCNGIAVHFGVSVILVRLLFLAVMIPLSTFGWLVGFAPYLALWLLMPRAKTTVL